ncbi:MAG: glycosyltransferase family 2 protein [Polyangiaceae bacterium]
MSLTDADEILRSIVGHPRTALWVGGTYGVARAQEVGARIVSLETGPEGKVDLALLTAEIPDDQVKSRLADVAPHVGDGGHVVVERAGRSPSSLVLDALRATGLEPLWRGRSSRPSNLITVARRPPERRELSLTVGMISMNEAAAVGQVIDGIRQHRPDAEVLLVDSSKDETPAIAEQHGARVIRQFPPRGYGPAMMRLLRSATTDVIVTMDCDGTYPSERIGDLHQRVEKGADLVNSSRTQRRPEAMPVANYVANRTFAAVAGVATGYWTTDLHSGMRAYRTSMLRALDLHEAGAALPVELLLVPAHYGYRTEEVTIKYLNRIGTTTLQRWTSTVWTFRRIAHAARTDGKRIR